LLAIPFKVARYVVYDDTIIAVRTSTNDNDIINNYNIGKSKSQAYGHRERGGYGEGSCKR